MQIQGREWVWTLGGTDGSQHGWRATNEKERGWRRAQEGGQGPDQIPAQTQLLVFTLMTTLYGVFVVCPTL